MTDIVERVAKSKWRTMESAPKDRTIILWGGDIGDTMSLFGLYEMKEPTTGNWDGTRWILGNSGGHDEFYIALNPSHWMPLPEPPDD